MPASRVMRIAHLSFSPMAVVPIRIVGDPVLHTATEPVPVGDDGSLPAGSRRLDQGPLRHDGRSQRSRTRRESDRRLQAGVRLRLRRRARPDHAAQGRRRQSRCWRRPKCRRRCRTRTTTTRAACRCPANRFRPAGRTGRGLPAWTPTATPITLEGNGLFARMLQHETGHLDGFLYLDRLVGRHARSAKRTVKSHGWGVPGLSWMPGEDPDPFGH